MPFADHPVFIGGSKLKIYYTDPFTFALPEWHSFPAEKYTLLRNQLAQSGIVRPEDLFIPDPATETEILRAHDPPYFRRVLQGELSPKEIRRIGLPWSRAVVNRARRSAGATVAACRAALRDGLAIHLGGGTHHAFRDRGEGYCFFNDSAIATRAIQAEGLATRILIIDCDVHQGNGTAAILAEDPSVFTFSIHGRNNFPFRKEQSDLDIALEDGATDATYLNELCRALPGTFGLAKPDIAIYLAGADPYTDDRFGRLAISKDGLNQRDRLVLEACLERRIPVALTMAGGYARHIQETVDIHIQTVRTASEMVSEGLFQRSA
jgi:acetoin utilization deacetylase AcuC-like enzyme